MAPNPLLFLGRISCIIIAGGQSTIPFGTRHMLQSHCTVEVLMQDLGTIQLSTLPVRNHGSKMTINKGNILLCGGSQDVMKCIQFDHGTWKDHSTLNRIRTSHSAVATQTATFLFGGSNYDIFINEAVYGMGLVPAIKSRKSYEYLPTNSNTWLMGKNEIPRGFEYGFAIASKCGEKVWLIGGLETEKRILSFDTQEHTFQKLPSQLNQGRRCHRCAYIPNTNKIMITGGFYGSVPNCYDSVEIFDTDDGSVTMASPMNEKRSGHGMGIVTINGEERLAVFGGASGSCTYLDSVELYNTQTEQWETTTIKMKEPKADFAFLEVKYGDIFSELK